MNEVKAVAAAVGMAVWGTGCAAMTSGGVLTIDPVELETRLEREEQRKKAEAARAELEALAKTTKTAKVSELGVTLKVPGDVEVESHRSGACGTPAMLLSGKASGFSVIVTNAADDRYDFAERLARHRSEFRYGIDVIRQNQGAGGTFEFEFSHPTSFTDGTRVGSERGYFARKNVGGKQVNCLISGVSDSALSRVIEACKTVATAK